MAPISNTSSSEGLTDSFWNFELPITRRGHFFQDSAFESAYEQLNSNVQRILQRWGETDFLTDLSNDSKLRPSDSLSRFRQLRRHNLKEDDQAVTVASDATTYKIVMDVQDFAGGDVKVRLEGDRELVVEGRTETKTGGWTSSSNSFRRRFRLPAHADVAAVSAVLSDDDILTISAPLKKVAREQKESEVPLVMQNTQATSSKDARASFSTSSTNSTEESTCTCRLGQQARSSDARMGREHIVPIQLDEDLCDSTTSEGTQATRESQSREFTSQVKTESAERNMNETSRSYQRAESSAAPSRASSVTSQTSNEKKNLTQSPLAAKIHYIPVNIPNQLPITRRGMFFDDSFFASMRQDFQSAMNAVLGRWGDSEALTSGRDNASCLGRYKELREHNLDVESQAVTVTSDETSHKVVIDVHNFLNGDVRVRVEGECELVVEGRTDTKTDDCAVSSNSFRRRFCLPANTDKASVSAVLSDDGILTVTAPRRAKQHQNKETTVPIKTEGLQQKREEHVTSSFSATTGGCSPVASCPSLNTSRQTSTASTQTDAPAGGFGDTIIKGKKEATSEMRESSSVVREASKHQSTPVRQHPIPGSVTLPISTRGSFFSDSFFKDAWKDFQEAVRDVVSKWGDPTCPADDLTHYRSLREQDLRDENQAVKFTDDKSNYKVVVDVQDFMTGGNIVVRSVQDRELVVEGHVERQEDGERYKKQFHRRFVLPSNIYSESVSSVMSADGVLTIMAPKKALPMPFRETIIPVAVEEGVHRTESLSHVSEESFKSCKDTRIDQKQQKASTTLTAAAERSSRGESQTKNISLDSSEKVACSREHIIPLVLEEEEGHSGSHRTGSASSVEENTHVTRKSESLESSHVLTVNGSTTTASTASETNKASDIRSCKTGAADNNLQNVAVSTDSKDYHATSASAKQRSEDRRGNTTSLPSVKTVPISLKGDFFSDSFFENMRGQFSTAVQDVLQQPDAASPLSDEMTSYRKQLRRNRRLENQAVNVEEDTRSFKIVLDVHEFVDGELTVEVENERVLVVEGQASCEEGASSSTLTFRRIFSLPSQANVAAITSALSSDGVLTIFTPKLQQAADSTTSHKMNIESRQEGQRAAARICGEQQVNQEATMSENSFSKTYSSSSSTTTTTTSSTQQQFSSHNVF